MSSLIVVALAGVACGVSIQGPVRSGGVRISGTGERSAGTDAAVATFAIRAIADAGLLDPTGDFYDYKSIEPTEGNWVATFDAKDCHGSLRSGACSEGPVANAQLHITSAGDALDITEATGPFDEEAKQKLLRYEGSDMSPQEPHFEYPYVEVVEFDEGERGILGSDIWTGPIPYGLPGGAGGCNGYLFNKQGEVIF